jgi:hypothetical protein
VTEKRSKHCDDLANTKLIPLVLPNYIPPLVGAVSRDSIPRDFEYTLITAYLLKGIRAVGPQLGLILDLKISDFNLGDRKNYAMLAPHRYLTKKNGRKPNIVPQPWIKEIVRSTILNVMKIPQFGRHQEVNACVKLLCHSTMEVICMLDKHVTMDLVLIHLITGLSMKGPDPHQFYLGKVADRSPVQRIKETYGNVEKGKRGYKLASIQDGIVRLACQMIVGKSHQEEPTDTSHGVRSRPSREVRQRHADELGRATSSMSWRWTIAKHRTKAMSSTSASC